MHTTPRTPHKFEKVITDDGTVSLYSKEYGEAMHSLSGAYEEALLKHVRPSRILSRTGGHLCVLDIGFGLGYNSLALLTEWSRSDRPGNLHIAAFEKEIVPAKLMDAITFADDRDSIYASLREAAVNGHAARQGYTIDIHRGDARRLIRAIDDISVHAIFHDPFSPAKNPELWTVDFFREEYRVADERCILTTYSSATHIRMALMEAGFQIGRGPSVGKKREGTLATKCAEVPPFTADEIEKMKNDIKAVPYRDSRLTGAKEEILALRKDEMRIKKGLQARQ